MRSLINQTMLSSNLKCYIKKSYIKKYLGSPTDIDVERLKVDYENLKQENLKLKNQAVELKAKVYFLIIFYKLDELKPPEE